MTPKQLRVLEVFWRAEQARMPNPTQKQLAEALSLSTGTVSDHVERLKEQGWLEQPNGTTKYRLTERGLKLMTRIERARERKEQQKQISE